MRKSKGRSRLIETLLKINDLIILDLVIDNFDEHFLNNSFDIDKTLNLDYDRKVIHIYRNIVSGSLKKQIVIKVFLILEIKGVKTLNNMFL